MGGFFVFKETPPEVRFTKGVYQLTKLLANVASRNSISSFQYPVSSIGCIAQNSRQRGRLR